MPKLIMTKGLPASGKSTWSTEMVDANPGKYKRVSKDSLRSMLDNNKWSGKNEKFVLSLRNTVVVESLKQGWNVIVDDTNLNPIHEPVLRELARENDAEFEIKDFTDVPVDVCISRDQKRQNYVGEKVIKEMYMKFLHKQESYTPAEGLPRAIICDLDGTLALFGNANPYDRDFLKDKVNEPIREILWKVRGDEGIVDTFVILVSGRSNKHRQQTKEWLKNNGIEFDQLYMRPDGDVRKDATVKREIFDLNIRDVYEVLFVLDDRNQVVDMWRSLGLTCLQVAYGDF